MDEIILTREDIDGLCGKNCNDCCRGLSQDEKIELTRFFDHAEDFHKSDDCLYISENGCSTYNFRPELCKNWTCQVIENLRKKLNG